MLMGRGYVPGKKTFQIGEQLAKRVPKQEGLVFKGRSSVALSRCSGQWSGQRQSLRDNKCEWEKDADLVCLCKSKAYGISQI